MTEALTIYAATDELQELKAGLQDISSELPILGERYQRLLQHFDALGVRHIKQFVNGDLADMAVEASVVDAAVTVLKNEKYRPDFDVYLKNFLMSMDIVLPHASAQPYRVPAKRFGYIWAVPKSATKTAA